MSEEKTHCMRSFHVCCLIILLMATACGKDKLHSPIIGKWKEVSYINSTTPNLFPPATILTLSGDRTFQKKIDATVIQSGTYRIGHTSNPPQDILYFENEKFGSRYSVDKDTLTLTYLGFTLWTPAVSKYVKN